LGGTGFSDASAATRQTLGNPFKTIGGEDPSGTRDQEYPSEVLGGATRNQRDIFEVLGGGTRTRGDPPEVLGDGTRTRGDPFEVLQRKMDLLGQTFVQEGPLYVGSSTNKNPPEKAKGSNTTPATDKKDDTPTNDVPKKGLFPFQVTLPRIIALIVFVILVATAITASTVSHVPPLVIEVPTPAKEKTTGSVGGLHMRHHYNKQGDTTKKRKIVVKSF